MTSSNQPNIGHSVFRRLRNLARERGVDFNLVLQRFGVERLLYRLGDSSHGKDYILKGASLFLVWTGQSFRVTRDIDLLGLKPVDEEHAVSVFKGLCRAHAVEDDGIVFQQETAKAEPIRGERDYGGIRITLLAVLHGARIPLQIDIAYGDVITPAPERIEYPAMLEFPAPSLLAYPRETLIAEKLETIVSLGMANSRMKDFYDVWLLSRLECFDGLMLQQAIRNTFGRRKLSFSASVPTALTSEFSADQHMNSVQISIKLLNGERLWAKPIRKERRVNLS